VPPSTGRGVGVGGGQALQGTVQLRQGGDKLGPGGQVIQQGYEVGEGHACPAAGGVPVLHSVRMRGGKGLAFQLGRAVPRPSHVSHVRPT